MRVALGAVQTLQLGRGDARALRPACGVAQLLEIPDPRMSGMHARIVGHGAERILEDAGSTNGTLVNGQTIAKHVLRDGDIIELGQTSLLYCEIDEVTGSLDARALAHLEPGFATLDPRLARRLERLARVAPSQLSILLLGETGTGKEVLARGLHA